MNIIQKTGVILVVMIVSIASLQAQTAQYQNRLERICKSTAKGICCLNARVSNTNKIDRQSVAQHLVKSEKS